jgi:RNA polymerase subunit RPABC4/transcription elongation factor Spt4
MITCSSCGVFYDQSIFAVCPVCERCNYEAEIEQMLGYGHPTIFVVCASCGYVFEKHKGACPLCESEAVL